MVKDFHQLGVWQKAMNLAVDVQALTKTFPKEELYGLVSQMRRASLSIAANIAEGFGRFSYADKKHKYVQARGELTEIMNYFYYIERVHYAEMEVCREFLEKCHEIHRMLNGLILKMETLDTAERPRS